MSPLSQHPTTADIFTPIARPTEDFPHTFLPSVARAADRELDRVLENDALRRAGFADEDLL